MCTGTVSDLISTIRSRSQQVAFLPLPSDVVVQYLAQEGFSTQDAGLLARISENSLGRIASWRRSEASTTSRKKSSKTSSEGDIIAVANRLAHAMDHLLLGQAGAGDVATVISEGAETMAGIFVGHDPSASKDRSTRDGGILMFALIELWLSDRLRSVVGRNVEFAMPSTVGGVDYARVKPCMDICAAAAGQLDANVHQPTAIMNACVSIEAVLRGAL